MWIFTVMPEWAVHSIFGLGILLLIAGTVLGFVPLVGRYKYPILMIGILTFTLGCYLEGGLADYKEWQFKAAELQVKIAELEKKAAQKNIEIQEKIVEKDKIIVKKGNDIIKYIDREIVKKEEVVKFVENCPIPKDIVDQHNAAARLNKMIEEGKK